MEEHRRILDLVRAELTRPVGDLGLPIGALRTRANMPDDDARWYALAGGDDLTDSEWVDATLPHLLDPAVSGDSDRWRPQVRMVEVMYDPERELRGFLRTTTDSDEYIALRGLLVEYVSRTQKALREAGITSLELSRRGDRSELRRNKNEARSWTTSPQCADSSGYTGDTIFVATVPVEHIAAFRDVAEQEVLVSRESLNTARSRLRLSIREEADTPLLQRLRNLWDVRNQ